MTGRFLLRSLCLNNIPKQASDNPQINFSVHSLSLKSRIARQRMGSVGLIAKAGWGNRREMEDGIYKGGLNSQV